MTAEKASPEPAFDRIDIPVGPDGAGGQRWVTARLAASYGPPPLNFPPGGGDMGGLFPPKRPFRRFVAELGAGRLTMDLAGPAKQDADAIAAAIGMATERLQATDLRPQEEATDHRLQGEPPEVLGLKPEAPASPEDCGLKPED